MRSKNESGSLMVLGAFLALAVATLILAMSKVNSFNVHQAMYLDGMKMSHRLAESGMNKAAGQLVNNPLAYASFNNVPVTVPSDDGIGIYNNVIQKLNAIIPGGYYIVTSATYTTHGRSYACRLHTHLSVSNVGSYFAAVQSQLTLSAGINIGQGRVYAPQLIFDTSGVTQVKSADFVISCTPPINWDNATKLAVAISEPAYPGDVSDPAKANQPTQLAAPMVFPQVGSADLARYQGLAGPHTVKSVFTGQIYPPGYQALDGSCTRLPGDTYTNHGCDNAQHVYYSPGDIHIEGVVNGQILFVAAGNIIITGNLQSADPSATLPGTGFVSSSTAHQAILITPNNVIIDSTYYQSGWSNATQTIQALVLAPNGSISANTYSDPNEPTNLSLNFNGSMIMGSQPDNLISVYSGASGRTYSYMNSLNDNPPPYLPAIVDIYYSLEEVTGSTNMF